MKNVQKNYTWAKCPSKKLNTHGGFSGEERSEEIREIISLFSNYDDKYSWGGNIDSST